MSTSLGSSPSPDPDGLIKSITRPELAAHVRREAVRFIDELKRTNPRAV